MFMTKRRVCMLLVAALLVLAAGYVQAQERATVLASFEDDSDFKLLTVRAVNPSIVDTRATDGDRSLQAIYTDGHDFPSLWLLMDESGNNPALPADWTPYEYVVVDVWNDSNFVIELYYAFIDQDDNKFDRFKTVLLPGRWTQFSVPVKDIPLDTSRMRRLELWMYSQGRDIPLYIDNIRLVAPSQ